MPRIGQTGDAKFNGGDVENEITNLTGALATATFFRSRITGDAASRLIVSKNGLIRWGDGTNPVDVNLQRGAAATMWGSGLWAFETIGANNIAAATVLGSVQAKMEVFDINGVSKGFIPIYDAIT